MEHREYKSINKSVRKKDSMQLLLGKPVYTDDLVNNHPLVVKILRSPHPNAIVEEINTAIAKKVPGVVDIYTWEDVPNQRFTNAGQTYPEASPYDRLILDRHVRFSGDAVAIIAAETEKAALKAMKLIKVKYQILEAVLDYHTAKDGEILVHPEEEWVQYGPWGGDHKRNLVATERDSKGDVDAVMADCDVVVDHVYHTKAFNQAMMETFRSYAEIDRYGRLHMISSTQIVFHTRRIIARALGISKSKVRVEKPRIGGGFGAKQTSVCDVYPAFVTWKTGRPSEIIYTREESQIAGSPRHEMEIKLRLGADKNGKIRAIDIYTLSNSGAYGEHGPTTVGLSGHKSIPMYTGSLEAYRFDYDVVYTNLQAAGAYRGYGATQGIFALESAVNELAEKLHMDPTVLRDQIMVKEGMFMPAYFGETANACALDRCMDCSVDDVAVFGADTDASPYDSGSYASSTTYITGGAVVKACEKLIDKMELIAAGLMNCSKEEVQFEGNMVKRLGTDQSVSVEEIATKSQLFNDESAEVTAMHTSPVSPPPYMVGMVEIELDKLTGKVDILDYKAVVDCGIPINPALARIQTEGGLVQGIGHTLMENVTYNRIGRPMECNFAQYKLPTRLDMGKLQVEFEHSYEPTGPFGAKSIGEIVINTPAPAIAHAIYRATGVWHRELPITPEQIALGKND